MPTDSYSKQIILDTDMGADDVWALLMLLKAEKEFKNIKISAITCVHGNTSMENAVKNTYRILHDFNRTDVRKTIFLAMLIICITNHFIHIDTHLQGGSGSTYSW